MAIVAHGLGQPEEGALVAGGLGITGADPNALRAVLTGAGAVTGTLTDGATPTPTVTGSPGFRGWVIPVPPRAPKANPGHLAAHLTGGSSVTAVIDFTLDPDHLTHELAVAFLLDLV